MEENHLPSDFKVNVKVDTTPGEDLIKVLEDMRQEYELIIKKKHQELDTWFREQVKESDLTSQLFHSHMSPRQRICLCLVHRQQPCPRRRPAWRPYRATKVTSMS